MNSRGTVAMHKRSKSDSDRRVKDDELNSFHHLQADMGERELIEIKRRPSPNIEMASSLRQEIQQLEKRLKDQFLVRHMLEKALGQKNTTNTTPMDNSVIPKPAKELIREIAMLELEVMYLEQYLLSLYRRAFDQKVRNAAVVKDARVQPLTSHSASFPEAAIFDVSSRKIGSQFQSCHLAFPRKSATSLATDSCVTTGEEKPCRDIHRSHSLLVHRSLCSTRGSSSATHLARALGKCHTTPLSFHEHEENGKSELLSLAAHLGTTVTDHIPETPNMQSEDMVRYMGAIYCKFIEKFPAHQTFTSSPASSFSSTSSFSPRSMRHLWSPSYRRELTLSLRKWNTFHAEEFKETVGPYNSMFEVSSICKAKRRCRDIENMLQKYKLLVKRLETVDPRTMNNEEKIAFWTNIHNAMLMHAHIEYGIPHNNVRRANLLLKSMYNIGGRRLSADMIQSLILGCSTHPPGQWLRVLLSPKTKIKDGSEWEGYAIEHPEPRLRFALCSGSHSDPPVRVYSVKRLFQQLETAKAEYIRAALVIRKEHKILLPKMVDSFARDSNLSPRELLDMINCCLPQSLATALQERQEGRPSKVVEWVPHNFTFRYLLSRELTIPQMR